MSPFETLVGHAAFLAAKIDVAAAAYIFDFDADDLSAAASYHCISSMDAVLAKQIENPDVFWRFVRAYSSAPPEQPVREACALFPSLSEPESKSVICLTANALLKWQHLLRLQPYAVEDQAVLFADASDAYEKLIGLQCLITGESPTAIERELAALIEQYLSQSLPRPDVQSDSDSPGSADGSEFYQSLKSRRVALIDLEAADANPQRGQFEEQLKRLYADTAVSAHPERFRHFWKALLQNFSQAFPWSPAVAPPRHISLKPAEDPTLRHITRVLAMVHELHKAGYQLIRISPGLSPSGCYWRCPVTFAANVRDDGFTIRNFDTEAGLVAAYTSGDEARYFGWSEGPSLNARQMAHKFLKAFPFIAEQGSGRDWLYAGWLTDVLGRAEMGGPNSLVVLYADYPVDEREFRLWQPPPPPR